MAEHDDSFATILFALGANAVIWNCFEIFDLNGTISGTIVDFEKKNGKNKAPHCWIVVPSSRMGDLILGY
jgi:hypothetical protein